MRSTLIPILMALCLAAPAAMAQVSPKAYAPEDLNILDERDQARVIAKEYMDQSGNRQIPDDQLEFYLDQVMIQDQHSPTEYGRQLNHTTFSEFKSFAASFLSNFRFTAFVTGNVFQ